MRSLYIFTEDNDFKDFLWDLIDKLHLDFYNGEIKECNMLDMDYIIVNRDLEFSHDILNCKYCFINMDLFKNKDIDINGNVITYGFGNKNTVTLSSIEENNEFLYCLQRYLSKPFNSIMEPQEIPFKVSFKSTSELYAYMVVITIALIEGTKVNELQKNK